MDYPLLSGIKAPKDIKRFDHRGLEQLAGEVREFLIEKVSSTGGHLSSNLGVVELTIALHRIFDSPTDVLVFDVGHQCYTHKLLTGRMDGFDTLRREKGLSGFPCPAESEHDSFTAGHGSTALSAAVGMAAAKKLKKEPGYVIAIIGDGAFTGGMVYEALNNAERLDNLILVLNDNKMSISKNGGGMANYFTSLRTSPGYYKAKNDVKNVLDNTPLIGEGMIRGIKNVKSALRRTIYKSTFFEELGFQYVGPIDGHDLPSLCTALGWLREEAGPFFLHVETKKGKGFSPAEQNPGAFHGVGSFNAANITDPDISPQDSFSTHFGRRLCRLGAQDKSICTITAAMKYGTGLQYFKKALPDRFFDVGMAEEHAVTFGAGLAKAGLRPAVCIYSTFLQRGYDQIIHDVMLQKLDVLFAIDRAGLVPADGETHQGIYDAAFLSQQPELPIVSPANYAELDHWLEKLFEGYSGPRAIRYPRGEEAPALTAKGCSGEAVDLVVEEAGAKMAIVTYGAETQQAMEACALLKDDAATDLYQMVLINPIDEGFVNRLLPYKNILFVEEGIQQGGIGEHLALRLLAAGFKGGYKHIAVPATGIDHATVPQLKKNFGLDAEGIAKTVRELTE